METDIAAGRRLTFLQVSQLPTKPPPWILGPTPCLEPDVGTLVLGKYILGAQESYQPYIETVLADNDTLVLIPPDDPLVLVRRNNVVKPLSHTWYPLPTTLMPPTLSEIGTNQLLSGSRVGVVGVGSLGSCAAHLLAAAGVEHLVLVDPDSLEVSNIRRHLCGAEHLAMSKTSAVRAELARKGYPTEVTEIVARAQVDRANEIRGLLGACDVVLCCTDSAAARQFVNHCGTTRGRPTVIADVQMRPEPLAEIIVTVPEAGGCFNCWRIGLARDGLLVPAMVNDAADYPESNTAASPSGLPMHHLAVVAAVACDFVAISRTPGVKSMVWLMAMDQAVNDFGVPPREARREQLARNPDCLVCNGE